MKMNDDLTKSEVRFKKIVTKKGDRGGLYKIDSILV